MADQKLTALAVLPPPLVSSDLIYVVRGLTSYQSPASVLDARYLQVASNLSDLASRQTALDTLTNVAAATNEYVLTKDTATGNAIFKAAPATGAPVGATYIVQTPDGTLTNEQALSALATGILKSTTGTGVVSIAAAGTDYLSPAAIGVTVQAWDADLDTIAGLAKTDGNFIVGDGAAWVVESGATARTSLGLVAGGAGDIWVEKAGDTMTGLLTYAQPSTVDAKFYSVDPGDPDARLFNWNIWTSDNIGSVRDNVGLNWGYNQAPGGGRDDITEPAFYQQLETFYAPGATSQFEYHIDYVHSNGAVYRPFHVNANRSTAFIDWSFNYDTMVWLSADGTFQGSRIDIPSSGAGQWLMYIKPQIRVDGQAFVVSNVATSNDIFKVETVANSPEGTIRANGVVFIASNDGSSSPIDILTLTHQRTTGTGDIYPPWGEAILFRAQTFELQTRNMGRLGYIWTSTSDASRAAYGYLSAYYVSTEREAIRWTAGSVGIDIILAGDVTIQDKTDLAKQVRFDLSGITTANTRVLGLPNQNTMLAGLAVVQTFTAAQTIDGTANAKQLLIQGHSTQTAPIQEWQKSDGTVLGYLTNAGELVLNNGVSLPAFDSTSRKLKVVGNNPEGGGISMYVHNAAADGYTNVNLIHSGGTFNDRLSMGLGGPSIVDDDVFQNVGYFYTAENVRNLLFQATKSDGYVRFDAGGFNNEVMRLDTNATSRNTRMMLYDVDNGQMERVSVGVADSGGVGYKVLRIAN